MPIRRLITRIRPGWSLALVAVCAGVALLVPSLAGAQTAPVIDPSVSSQPQGATWNKAIPFSMDDATDATSYSLYRILTTDPDPTNCPAMPMGSIHTDTVVSEASITDPTLNLADGLYCYWVESNGAAGPLDSMPVVVTYDKTAPIVSIDVASEPQNPTGSSGASFTFSDSEGTPVCILDTVVVGCTSGASMDLSALTDGSHTFKVSSTDGAGNEGHASYTWTVDTHAPVVTITPASEPSDPSTSRSATFAYTATDATTTVGTPQCKLDAGSFGSCTPLNGLADGSHTFTVEFPDSVQNEGMATYTWTVDATPPGVPTGVAVAASPTNAAPVISWTASTGSPANYAVLRNGSQIATVSASASPLTYTDSATLSDATYVYTVQAVDVLGNASAPSSGASEVLDTSAPATPSNVHVAATPTNASPVISWDASTGATGYNVYRGGVLQMAVTSPTYTDTSTLADGTYVYTVDAVDAANNRSGASSGASETIDKTGPPAPTTVTVAKTPTNTAPVISWNASASGSPTDYQVLRDGALVGTVSTLTFTDSPVPTEGSHTYTVVARDALHNAGPASTGVTDVFDSTAPPSQTFTMTTPSLTNTAPTFTYSLGSDANGAFTYQLYRDTTAIGSPNATGTLSDPLPVSGDHSTDGTHTYTVRVTDAAGNVATLAASSATIDTRPPTVPSDFVLTPRSTSSVPVFTFSTTTDPNGAVKFELTRKNESTLEVIDTGLSRTTTIITPTNLSDTSVLLDGRNDGVYDYYLHITDLAGNAVDSSIRVVTIDAGPPSVPGTVRVGESPTRSAPVVSWTASTGDPATYQVSRDGVPVGAVFAPMTTFTDSSLPLDGSAEGAHTYTVTATDAHGNTSAASATASVVIDTTRPVSATSLAIKSPTSTKPALVWAASSDPLVAGYRVYRGSTLLNSTLITGTGYTDNSISGDGSYTYTIRAVDTAGNESLDSAAATVVFDTTAPTPPVAVAATAATGGTAKLTWSASSDAGSGIGSYQVRRSAAGGTSPITLTDGTPVCGVLAPSSTSCSDSGLTPGATYRYSVFALDAVGNVSVAGTSAPVSAPVSKDTTPPKAPTTIKEKVVNAKVVLTWKNPTSDLAKIVVVWNATRAPRSSSDGKRVYTGKATTFSLALTKLPAGKKVHFGVFALDAAGNASRAAAATVTVPQAGPLSIAPGGKLSGSPTLSWKTIANTKYYNVQVFEGSGTTNRVAIAWPFTTHVAIPASKLVKGKTYTWYVWPGIGAKAAAKYGTLIGHQTFTYTGK